MYKLDVRLTQDSRVRAVAQKTSTQMPRALKRAHPFLSSLAVDQLYSSVSRLGGLKFFTPEFGWARAKRGTRWPSSWHTDEVVLGNLKAQTKTTMTSTNMFQGLDTGSKPSSR